MRLPRALVLLASSIFLLPPAWGLEGEVGLKVERTLIQVAAGPPETPAQEVGTDRARIEATATHRQGLAEGWSAEGSVDTALDTLPSGDSRSLPDRKLAFSAAVLEAWLNWEPLPGTLVLGAGKRVIQPSSGFSHKPLDWVSRADNREGRTGAQISGFTEAWSASVFAAPSWPADGTEEAFVLGRIGVNLGPTDLKTQVYRASGVTRGGLGLDSSWGDRLTIRAEAAADADFHAPRTDVLGGLTWTGEEQNTLMVEGIWDARKPQALASGFLRWSQDLDENLKGEAWVRADGKPGTTGADLSGWTGLSVTLTSPKWSLEGAWTGAWGSVGTPAGDNPLRWKTTLEAKSYW